MVDIGRRRQYYQSLRCAVGRIALAPGFDYTSAAEAHVLFPDSQRVIYELNPLVEVICQLRFPAVLKIDAEVPAQFQEAIRQQYPTFRQKQQVSWEGLPQIAQQAFAQAQTRVAYDFISRDGLWKVSLVRDFVAVSTTRYTRWEDFRSRLSQVCDALIEAYAPAFFSRIGLRYKDLVFRSNLGLVDVPWKNLLQPHIAGELANEDLASAVTETVHQTVYQLSDPKGAVRVQHGLAMNTETHEQGYLIDADFYCDEPVDLQAMQPCLDGFNKHAGRFFRSCITEQLHRAMKPAEVSDDG
ncbi:MAG: TIGR04255 family protein [Deltaproteobacteria bacterium]|nr:TIGR04255 family protein [Deltaproteobacteria bacterium]